jgi:hypothetical protein
MLGLQKNGREQEALDALQRAEVLAPEDLRFRYARENLQRHMARDRAASEENGS